MSNDYATARAEGVNELPPCSNCGHEPHVRTCEYEPGDAWATGNQASQPTVLMALPPCGCRVYEPMTKADLEEEYGYLVD